MPERILIHKPGGYARLQAVPFSPPEPGAGEVQVDVKAIGVNYADCIVRMGLYESARVYSGYPICPGFEAAGTVAGVGSAVSDFAAGDRVVALTRFNAYATSVTVPASQIRPLPPDVTFTQGAALPTVFLTAWYAAWVLGDVKPGQSVLVHSAAGGVGSSLVQLCKHAGCRVTGVVGQSGKMPYVKTLGADVVIDRSRDDFWSRVQAAEPEGYDVVFDANGVATLQGSYDRLRAPGRLVVYGFHTMLPKGTGRVRWPVLAWRYIKTPRFNPLDLTGSNKSVMGFNLSFLFERPELLLPGLAHLAAGLAEGWFQVPAITTFPFARVAEAHRALETGNTIGKLVLVVD